MSKILFLADLHGNMPATLALEEEMKRIQPDEVGFMGDCVGKGPESHKTTDWVRANCNHFIAGNWDRGCVEFSKNCPPGFESDAFYRITFVEFPNVSLMAVGTDKSAKLFAIFICKTFNNFRC